MHGGVQGFSAEARGPVSSIAAWMVVAISIVTIATAQTWVVAITTA